ncbi:MAG: hypothetical protein AMXMBFR83_05870 [Phycisphaerae bacterium]
MDYRPFGRCTCAVGEFSGRRAAVKPVGRVKRQAGRVTRPAGGDEGIGPPPCGPWKAPTQSPTGTGAGRSRIRLPRILQRIRTAQGGSEAEAAGPWAGWAGEV